MKIYFASNLKIRLQWVGRVFAYGTSCFYVAVGFQWYFPLISDIFSQDAKSTKLESNFEWFSCNNHFILPMNRI